MRDARDQGKILIIDDDISLLRLVKVALEANGFSVAAATNGAEGMQFFAAQSPDLVILDVMMPELDGRDVCVRLREQSAVPVLFLSGNCEVAARIEGLRLGATRLDQPCAPRTNRLTHGPSLRTLRRIGGHALTVGFRLRLYPTYRLPSYRPGGPARGSECPRAL